MTTHNLKCDADQFQLVLSGRKKFEARRNDRDYKEGDILVLHEQGNEKDPGRTLNCLITHVMLAFRDHWGLGAMPGDVAIMSIHGAFLMQPEFPQKISELEKTCSKVEVGE